MLLVAAKITAETSAQLVRAAIGYAGLKLGDVEQRTGIKTATLRGYASRSRPVEATLEKRLAIGEACGVPRSFMESGFEANGPAVGGGAQALLDRIARLEKTAYAAAGTVDTLVRLLLSPTSDDAERLRGLLRGAAAQQAGTSGGNTPAAGDAAGGGQR